jgi:sucrose-phosphate synthase
MPEKNGDHPISILLIIIHGLIRARDLELGRDADTGGQTTYVAGFGSDPSNAQDQRRATVKRLPRILDTRPLNLDVSQALYLLRTSYR